ncbi:hypothetical protein AX774_g5347 [Zancudomyces culisetae]|uniref:Uncharacterized protein n=1 Tax=Zancudomyces culisetae TaxID=1213189 RepID=A0A1R1PJX9_ZANCU|nr:hypothetical protein AX774_g5347 [Zancudomyces culisetae]|eukprot:OMH81192.1 hypothetical protein AX774_g5347 [Zancudomyces culisetae]
MEPKNVTDNVFGNRKRGTAPLSKRTHFLKTARNQKNWGNRIVFSTGCKEENDKEYTKHTMDVEAVEREMVSTFESESAKKRAIWNLLNEGVDNDFIQEIRKKWKDEVLSPALSQLEKVRELLENEIDEKIRAQQDLQSLKKELKQDKKEILRNMNRVNELERELGELVVEYEKEKQKRKEAHDIMREEIKNRQEIERSRLGSWKQRLDLLECVVKDRRQHGLLDIVAYRRVAALISGKTQLCNEIYTLDHTGNIEGVEKGDIEEEIWQLFCGDFSRLIKANNELYDQVACRDNVINDMEIEIQAKSEKIDDLKREIDESGRDRDELSRELKISKKEYLQAQSQIEWVQKRVEELETQLMIGGEDESVEKTFVSSGKITTGTSLLNELDHRRIEAEAGKNRLKEEYDALMERYCFVVNQNGELMQRLDERVNDMKTIEVYEAECATLREALVNASTEKQVMVQKIEFYKREINGILDERLGFSDEEILEDFGRTTLNIESSGVSDKDQLNIKINTLKMRLQQTYKNSMRYKEELGETKQLRDNEVRENGELKARVADLEEKVRGLTLKNDKLTSLAKEKELLTGKFNNKFGFDFSDDVGYFLRSSSAGSYEGKLYEGGNKTGSFYMDREESKAVSEGRYGISLSRSCSRIFHMNNTRENKEGNADIVGFASPTVKTTNITAQPTIISSSINHYDENEESVFDTQEEMEKTDRFERFGTSMGRKTSFVFGVDRKVNKSIFEVDGNVNGNQKMESMELSFLDSNSKIKQMQNISESKSGYEGEGEREGEGEGEGNMGITGPLHQSSSRLTSPASLSITSTTSAASTAISTSAAVTASAAYFDLIEHYNRLKKTISESAKILTLNKTN